MTEAEYLELFLFIEEHSFWFDGLLDLKQNGIEKDDKFIILGSETWRELNNDFLKGIFGHVKGKYTEFYTEKFLWFNVKKGIQISKANFQKWKNTIEDYHCDAEVFEHDLKTHLGVFSEVIFDQRDTANRYLLRLHGYRNVFLDQATKRPIIIHGDIKKGSLCKC